MAVDMFLKIDEIAGESNDATHANEIDVLAWSWGASQSGTMHMGSGGGAGKVSVQDLSITKYVDSGSNLLLKYCHNGDHFPEAVLVVRKAGGTPIEYIKLTMKHVLVSSVSTGGSGGEDRLTENVTLNFKEFYYTYLPQADDGTEGAAKDFNWDIAGNTEL